METVMQLVNIPTLMFGDIRAAHLPLMLLLVFGAAKLSAELLERFGQPGLVGEILAGILLGPSVLNWIHPDQVLTALSELGVMFLLFRVGLEVRVTELFRVGKTALLVAIAGVALPLVSGWLVCTLFGTGRIEAVFVGASLVATSIGITAHVLAAKGMLDELASRVILTAAVIDDILGLLVLAIVSGIAQSNLNIPGLLTTALVAGLFTFVVARFGPATVKRLYPHLERKLSAKYSQFHMALVCVFALSLLSVYVGVAAIIGAFLAGLAFSDAADRRVSDLTHGITELLLPFFFVGIGLQLHLSSFNHANTILFAIALTIVAVLTKFIGCGMAALAYGPRDALRVGVGMIPRGEVGMIVAQIGISFGAIQQPEYAAVVFMAMATTVLTPLLLDAAFRGSKPVITEEGFDLV